MICKFCGKPLSSNKCIYCGHSFKTIQSLGDVDSSLRKDEKKGSELNSGVQGIIDEITDFSTVNEQNVVSENKLANTGFVLAICSTFMPYLTIPAFIISIVALNKSKRLNGAGHRRAMKGLIISGIFLAIYIVYAFIVFGTDFLRGYLGNGYL